MATEKTIQGLSDKLYSKLVWRNNQPRVFQLIGTGSIDKFNHNVSEGISGLEIRRGGTFPASTNIYDPFEAGADKMKVVCCFPMITLPTATAVQTHSRYGKK